MRPKPIVLHRGSVTIFPNYQSGKESLIQAALGLLHCYYCVAIPSRTYKKKLASKSNIKMNVWAKNKKDALMSFRKYVKQNFLKNDLFNIHIYEKLSKPT